MIGIIDYGLGNLRSVAGAVERLGREPVITSDAGRLAEADKLILPGVGAFGDGMRNLRSLGLVEPLGEMVLGGRKPLLGICLGSQLLCLQSEEFGIHQGLGWIDARVRLLTPEGADLRIPHVGWNDLVRTAQKSILFDGIPEDALFYFVHSYHIVAPEAIVVARCEYGTPFVAAFESGNVYATQFHPEKSQQHGLTLLGNFLEKG
jgi:glutamine amidotransferase